MTCAQEACPILNMHCKLCFSAARAVCRWAYEQVAEALCKLYKDPHGRVGQHLHHGSPRAGCPGALADALLALAQGLASAHTDIRYALHLLCCHPHLPGSPPPPICLGDKLSAVSFGSPCRWETTWLFTHNITSLPARLTASFITATVLNCIRWMSMTL